MVTGPFWLYEPKMLENRETPSTTTLKLSGPQQFLLRPSHESMIARLKLSVVAVVA